MQEAVESKEDCLAVWPHIMDYVNEEIADLAKMSHLEGKSEAPTNKMSVYVIQGVVRSPLQTRPQISQNRPAICRGVCRCPQADPSFLPGCQPTLGRLLSRP